MFADGIVRPVGQLKGDDTPDQSTSNMRVSNSQSLAAIVPVTRPFEALGTFIGRLKREKLQ
jgi:hypothetical protein